jgi:hypothetical protein
MLLHQFFQPGYLRDIDAACRCTPEQRDLQAALRGAEQERAGAERRAIAAEKEAGRLREELEEALADTDEAVQNALAEAHETFDAEVSFSRRDRNYTEINVIDSADRINWALGQQLLVFDSKYKSFFTEYRQQWPRECAEYHG